MTAVCLKLPDSLLKQGAKRAERLFGPRGFSRYVRQVIDADIKNSKQDVKRAASQR